MLGVGWGALRPHASIGVFVGISEFHDRDLREHTWRFMGSYKYGYK